jgi:hypothetical protein
MSIGNKLTMPPVTAMTFKHAKDCTYQEMIDRFWKEIRRAIRNDWPDTLEAHCNNLQAFLGKYRKMEPGETIREFDARTASQS